MTPFPTRDRCVDARAARGGVSSKWVVPMLAMGIAFSAPEAAMAATQTTTMSVTSTVQATCQVAVTTLAFGTYTGVQTDTSSIVTVTCTNTTPYNIGLSAGLASGATVTTRKMAGPSGALLSYGLYTDAARSVNWGNTVATDTVAGTGSGNAQAITIYGRELAGQFVTPGSYTDTITVTVTY